MKLNSCFSNLVRTLLILLLVMNFKVVVSRIRFRVSFMEGKIVGGKAVPIEKYPFVAMVFNNGAMCAGSILNSWTVLSAAHCFYSNKDVDEITVHVGARHTHDFKAEIHGVEHVIEHPDYDMAMPFACDIALVFVDRPFSFGKKVQRALLVNHDLWMSELEHNFTVTGWGMIKYNGPVSEAGLLKTQLRFIPSDTCGRMHEITLTPDMFCLYGDGTRDSCKGDSGGGVLWHDYVVGIVSHGDGCGEKNRPSVYSNVWYFRKWIQTNVEEYFRKYCSGFKYKRRKRWLRRNCSSI